MEKAEPKASTIPKIDNAKRERYAGKAIIFDMDGVLIDSNPFHKVSLYYFVRRYGFQLTEEELKSRVYGRTNRQWIRDIFGDIPPEQIKELADEKEEVYREMYRAELKPLDGLIPFLTLLNTYGIPRAIATSAPQSNVRFTLNGTGMRDFFPIILDESFVTHGKPDPEIYIKTAAALEKEPGACVVFEDSLSGIEAAQKAGCKVVGITTTHTAEELRHTDFVLRDYTGIDPYDVFEKVFG